MRYLKTYEIFSSKENWKVGDWLVAKIGYIQNAPLFFYTERGKLLRDHKYEISEIIDTSKFGQTTKNFPITVKDEDGNLVRDITTDESAVEFLKDNFITLEEWEVIQKTDKYNI